MSIIIRPYKRRGQKSEGWEVDIRVRLQDGTRYRERTKAPTDSKSATVRWASDRESHLLRFGLPEPTKEVERPKKFKEFVPEFTKSHLEANRLSASHRCSAQSIIDVHLKPAFGELQLDAITSKGVSDFIATHLAKLKPKTVNNVLTLLKTMLSKAVEWGMLDKSPRISKLRYHPDEMEFYDFLTFDKLASTATKIDPRYLALVLLGGRAGLRAGEMVALEWASVRFDTNELHVRQSQWKDEIKRPKSGKARVVPMTRDLVAALKAVPRNLHSTRVLVQDDGSHVNKDVLNTWMSRIQRRAVFHVNGRLHILRHTFCSHLAMRGATSKAIQELAGHASLTTTQRYMHLSSSAKSDAIALLENDDAGRPAGGGQKSEELKGTSEVEPFTQPLTVVRESAAMRP